MFASSLDEVRVHSLATSHLRSSSFRRGRPTQRRNKIRRRRVAAFRLEDAIDRLQDLRRHWLNSHEILPLPLAARPRGRVVERHLASAW